MFNGTHNNNSYMTKQNKMMLTAEFDIVRDLFTPKGSSGLMSNGLTFEVLDLFSSSVKETCRLQQLDFLTNFGFSIVFYRIGTLRKSLKSRFCFSKHHKVKDLSVISSRNCCL